MDSWAWLPKTCYASGFSPADIYEKDFCAEEYNEFLVSSRPNTELASSYIQGQITSRMHRWREKDAYEFRSISYQDITDSFDCTTNPCECTGYGGSGNFCHATNRADASNTDELHLNQQLQMVSNKTIMKGLSGEDKSGPKSDHGEGRMLDHNTGSSGGYLDGYLCGGLDSTTPVCSRTAVTDNNV